MLVFFVSLAGTVGIWWHLHRAGQQQEAVFRQEMQYSDLRLARIASAMAELAPPAKELTTLQQKILTHNFSLIGPALGLTALLSQLESILPADSAILRLESLKSGKALFRSGDQDYRLTLFVPALETATLFYQGLAAIPAFQSINFTPKNPIDFQERHGIEIEVTFRFGAQS